MKNKFFLTVVLLFQLFLSTNAQVSWVKTFDYSQYHASNISALKIIEDYDGGILIGLGNNLTKLKPNGVIEYTKQYDGYNINSIAKTLDNGNLIALFGSRGKLIKSDQNGHQINSLDISLYNPRFIKKGLSNNFFIGGKWGAASLIIKVTQEGDTLWSSKWGPYYNPYGDSYKLRGYSLANSNFCLMFYGDYSGMTHYPFIMKCDTNGVFTNGSSGLPNENYIMSVKDLNTLNGYGLLTIYSSHFPNVPIKSILRKYNSNSILIKTIEVDLLRIYDFLEVDNGGLIFCGQNSYIRYTDDEGNNTVSRNLTHSGLDLKNIVALSDGSVIVGGFSSNKAYIFKITNVDYLTDITENENPEIKEYLLTQNYPNPFNPSTTISYQLPKQSEVKLTIYNTLGETVGLLVNETKSVGKHEVSFVGDNLPSGVYLYRLETSDYSETKKMVLLK